MGINNPKVSIILPTFNRKHLLARSINSVLSQTYKEFELIVINDGSTDETDELMRNYRDKRIRYIRHQKNMGGPVARNTGILKALGSYIAFQDDDDEWFPDKLKKQVTLLDLARQEVGVVYTGFWRIEKNKKKTYIPSKYVTKKNGRVHEELLRGNFITTQSMLIRKECFKKAGMFDESLPRQQDWDLVLRISKYYEFKCIDEPLFISYYQPLSISSNQNNYYKALEIILNKYYTDFVKNKKLLGFHFRNLGFFFCSEGQLKKGRLYLLKAIKSSPPNLKAIILLFFSFSGEDMFNRIFGVFKA